MRRRRKTEVFGLSFLDCICCGFGATVLIYMILNSGQKERFQDKLAPMRAETDRLEQQVLEGQANLVELRNTLDNVREDAVTTRGLSTRLIDVVKESQDELATFERETIAQREHVNKLQADLRSLEEGNKRLSGGAPSKEVPGDKVRGFVGNGDRQYLTGMKVGGKRILFLVDASASMLADTIVNVVRRRLLPDADRMRADKWRRAVRAVDWLTTQLPRDSTFQVYVFDTEARPILPDTEGRWIEARDRKSLDAAVAKLRSTAPRGGTSLERAFAAAAALRPDNIILLTDGLPTQGVAPPTGRTVSGKERVKLFDRARHVLPPGVPVNTLLFPMEGDPVAAPAFWKLAIATNGSFMTPVEGLAVKRPRREIDVFSLSFLDCICCGFGAIILLLTLTRMSEPRAIENAEKDLKGRIARLEQELYEIRGESVILSRELRGRREQLSDEQVAVARLQGDLSHMRGQWKASKELSRVQDILAGRMLAAQQELTEEMKRLQAQQERRPRDQALVAGIPADSEYIVFVIDTSGSMQRFAWTALQRKMAQTLDAYPRVKGLQVMNDEGVYMFSSYAGKWIPDTPARRQAVIQRLAGWNAFSNSSPVEGIEAAIRTLASHSSRISIYVLGDEFTGDSIDRVLTTVDRLNARGGRDRRVRIHAIGFPTLFGLGGSNENTTVRFAMLMRALCERNGGTFVGLNSTSP